MARIQSRTIGWVLLGQGLIAAVLAILWADKSVLFVLLAVEGIFFGSLAIHGPRDRNEYRKLSPGGKRETRPTQFTPRD